jgi:hypothetical protein
MLYNIYDKRYLEKDQMPQKTIRPMFLFVVYHSFSFMCSFVA